MNNWMINNFCDNRSSACPTRQHQAYKRFEIAAGPLQIECRLKQRSKSRDEGRGRLTSTVTIWFHKGLFSFSTKEEPRTTDTQWRYKSKISEKLGRCGRKNMLRPYLFWIGIEFSAVQGRLFPLWASVVRGCNDIIVLLFIFDLGRCVFKLLLLTNHA